MKNKLTLITLLLTGGLAYAQTMGTMSDSRDGKTYETVTIGNQEWMAENLHYEMSGAYAYKNDLNIARTYGLLYTWRAAMKACPTGWHLPSDTEWNILVNHFGGGALKSTSGWKEGGNGTNFSGFNALPAGNRRPPGTFIQIGDQSSFWSSTEMSKIVAWYCRLGNSYRVWRVGNKKEVGHSCRCMRDTLLLTGGLAYAQTMGTMSDSRDGKTYETVTIGNQEWMAENLHYEMSGAYAYKNDLNIARTYGLLYTWRAAMKACPTGWHLPSDTEWNILVNHFGGGALKSTSGWKEGGNGTNFSGFNALPAGNRRPLGTFIQIGDQGSFWSSTELSKSDFGHHGFIKDIVWYRSLGNNYVSRNDNKKEVGHSCRCIQDY